MKRGRMLVLGVVLGLGCAAGVGAADLVAVRGCKTRFTTTMEVQVNGKPVKMRLTGTALRQKYFVNVYSMASYVQEGVTVRSPEELAAADCVKQLHLVMERNVSGQDLALALIEGIRRNYPAPALNDEVSQLADMLRNDTARQGDHIYLTHLPGVGLRVSVSDRPEVVISNPQISRALWDIYLGPNNLGEAIKKGLLSAP